MLAKTVTTLDVVSGGRAVLGIGAGWFELEHQQFGFEFGTFTDRFERLDEALQIIAPMLRGERPDASTASGTTPRTRSTSRACATTCRSCSAAAARRRRSGSRPASPTTSTSSATRPTCRASSRPSQQRCDEVDRDPTTLETSFLAFVMVDEDGDTARRMQRDVPADARRRPAARRCAERAAARDRPAVRRQPGRGRRASCRRGCSTRASTASSSTWSPTATSRASSNWSVAPSDRSFVADRRRATETRAARNR